MNHLCKNNCVPICGFCYNYQNGKCIKTNEDKELSNDCNINKFCCFTLKSNYKKEEYLSAEYIKKLFYGEDII